MERRGTKYRTSRKTIIVIYVVDGCVQDFDAGGVPVIFKLGKNADKVHEKRTKGQQKK
jgi:hypothetical protein